jgi:predicted nucleic acid-binding protein
VIQHVLIDAGPLTALVNPRDQWHDWVRGQFADLVPPLLTCEAVVSEACFLLRRAHDGVAAILGLIDRGVVELSLSLNTSAKLPC